MRRLMGYVDSVFSRVSRIDSIYRFASKYQVRPVRERDSGSVLHRIRRQTLSRIVRFRQNRERSVSMVEYELSDGNAIAFEVDCGEYSGRAISLQILNPGLVRGMRVLTEANPSMSFVDVGANYGAYSLVASLYFPSVICFEPHPVTFDLLARNARRYECSRIAVHNAAVADRTTSSAILSENPVNPGGSSIVSRHEGGRMFDVPCLALDEVLPAGRDYFLKIDVEGAEVGVFEGGSRVLREGSHVVYLETHKRNLLRIAKGGFLRQHLLFDDTLRPVDLNHLAGLTQDVWLVSAEYAPAMGSLMKAATKQVPS